MVRAHALPRPTGFALLKPAAKLQLDSTRILTLSSTLAFNLLAFGLLMMPMALPPPTVQDDPSHDPVVRSVNRMPQVVEIKPIAPALPQVPTTTLERQRVAAAHSDRPATTVIAATGSQSAVETATTSDETNSDHSIGVPDSSSVTIQLAYRIAPAPAYPRAALQRQLSGSVLLQVLVDIDGHPLTVTIARSSGHRELDEAARMQVLKRWSFQPANLNGEAVQAIGMVPVEFNLQR